MYAMFSQFGKIIDVVALKTLRLRGQAWIVFTDVSAATSALRTMQGFPFFEKPIVGARSSKHLPDDESDHLSYRFAEDPICADKV